MFLSDISIKRPVFASVLSLLLIAFGLLCFSKLPLREHPDIDPPIISIETNYKGAAANVVESRITELIEDRVSGVAGIKTISSTSSDGKSNITIEFNIDVDIEAAANDIRDRVATISDNLPQEAETPEVQKSNSDDDVIIWFNLNGENMSVMELTDYARRYITDRFSVLDGVARVRIGGAKDKAMRIWLDREKLAARNLTANDVEYALRSENVELPAGQILSLKRDFTVRIKRSYNEVGDFEDLVLGKSDNGYLIRLSDVAKVAIEPEEKRGFFRGNGSSMIGIGIIKQSQANSLDVVRLAKREMISANSNLPKNMNMEVSYDTSVFIDSAIREVYKTLFVAMILVIVVMYVFLGNLRLTIVPAVTVPVSLVATFIALYLFGYTLNLLTILAFVLAIGLVVDDAIVVLENIHRRLQLGESPLVAAYKGSRQVGFAVITTTLVLVAVFVPISFLEGDMGRLFGEFSIALVAAVCFSSFVALSLSPMLASKLLNVESEKSKLILMVDGVFEKVSFYYRHSLNYCFAHRYFIIILFSLCVCACVFLFAKLPREFSPKEDRGVIFFIASGPEGASFQYTGSYMNELEQRLMPFVETGEFHRLLVRMPRSFGSSASFNAGIGIIVLGDWSKRKPIWYYVDEIRKRSEDLVGIRVFPIVRQAFSAGNNKPVQFVLGGADYDELVQARDEILRLAQDNKNLLGLDDDYKETKPQMSIRVKKDVAADVGVSVQNINATLETMLGSRRVTTYLEDGEEYDVILEGKRGQQMNQADLNNIYVKSERNSKLIALASLIEINEFAAPESLRRYNRLRAITIEGNLADGYSLGEALSYLADLVRDKLELDVNIDYKGESLSYQDAGKSLSFIFLMALIIVFLVMAAQFESFLLPFVIMLTVPLAIIGALCGLYFFGQTINIYSQIGLIILIGLATKNGVLIVEFINQLRDEGVEFSQAIIEASSKRLRPILMTSLTTIMGSLPLFLSNGAGTETRFVMGIVIFSGVLISTILTLYIVPLTYKILAKNTSSPALNAEKLERELQQYQDIK